MYPPIDQNNFTSVQNLMRFTEFDADKSTELA